MAAPALRRVVRLTPLVLVWLVAAWPVVLWLVHAQDPEAAVAVVKAAQRFAATAAWWLGGGSAALVLLYPPAPAWLRLCWQRTWTTLTMDPAPLQKAMAELHHFETASRHAELGRLLRLRRQNEQAIGHLRRAVELDPGIASAWHQLGLVGFALHDWQGAAHAFAMAEQLDPGHAFGDALLHLGRCRHELAAPDALDLLREHQRRHGGGPKSHVWYADALQRAGDGAGARAALQQAAAPPRQRLTAEENWHRARARVRLWGRGGAA